MYEELQKLIHSAPWRAFTVYLSDGRSFPVPTRGHVMLTKKATLHLQNDEGIVDIIGLRQISSVQLQEMADA